MGPPAAGASGAGVGGLEIATVVLLLVGGFLFGIGWIVGLILVWSSRRWTPVDKLLGTLLFPGGLVLPVLAVGGLLYAASGSCSDDFAQAGKGAVVQCTSDGGVNPVLGIVIMALLVIVPIATGIHLVRRARRA
ncbi:hypothetical protein [Actinacidiphila soli]|uniref:hypothetical protein n=1 Tax=Actinacidiphila soli TaxID=2487275 RepID=UPI000FCB0C4E|nr:hypothetical protein [Actinacidiphila soli]